MNPVIATLEISKDENGPTTDQQSNLDALRSELQAVDGIEAVTMVPGQSKSLGSRTGDGVTTASFILTLAASHGAHALVTLIKSWLTRDDKRHAVISVGKDKLQLTGLSSEQQDKIIDTWVAKHSDKTSQDN